MWKMAPPLGVAYCYDYDFQSLSKVTFSLISDFRCCWLLWGRQWTTTLKFCVRLQTRSVQQGSVKSKTVYLWSCGTVTSRRTRRPQYFSSLEGHIGKKTSGLFWDQSTKTPAAVHRNGLWPFFRTAVRKQKQNNYYYIHFFPTILILSCRKIAEDDCISGAFYTYTLKAGEEGYFLRP